MTADYEGKLPAPTYHIDGDRTLWVDDSPVARITVKEKQERCLLMVVGPMDCDKAAALAQGLVHLTALIKNTGIVAPPAKAGRTMKIRS